MTHTYIADDDIEVRVDLERPESAIEYRILADEYQRWHTTPFRRADVTFEAEALDRINAWLERNVPLNSHHGVNRK